jgi:cytochrome c oxidase assembly factor CtaG
VTAEHMIEHSVLAMLVAPAIVLAWVRLGLPRVRLGHPAVAWVAFVAVQWVFHLTPVVEESQGAPVLHLFEHVVFVAAGVWFWVPVLGWGLGDPGRSLYLFGAAPAIDLVGAALITRGDEAEGVAMLAGGLPVVAAAVWVTWEWLAREQRQAAESEHPPATRLAVGGFAPDARRQRQERAGDPAG